MAKKCLVLLAALYVGMLPVSFDENEVKSSWWDMLYPAYNSCDTEDMEIRLKIADIIRGF